MLVINFRHKQGYVVVGALISRIAEYYIARARKILLYLARHRGVESRKTNTAVQVRLARLHDLVSDRIRDWRVLPPVRGFGILLAGGPIRGGYLGEVEPWMVLEQFYEFLSDSSGCA